MPNIQKRDSDGACQQNIMLPPHRLEWNENDLPLAYFLTIRTYGPWLHGDERHSVDTHDRKNIYGAPDRPANPKLLEKMELNLGQSPVVLPTALRSLVKKAISEVCLYRRYRLFALNVRSNHVHIVVVGSKTPEKIAEEFKKYATRKLRQEGLIAESEKVWSRGASTIYLWKETQLEKAIGYVLFEQGDSEATIDIT